MGVDLSKDKPTHEVFVYTGDKKGGSVRNITVFLTLTDASGEISKEQKLTKWHDNDFGKRDREEIKLTLPGFTKITDITIRRGDGRKNDEWYVERVVVEHRNDEGGVLHSSIFPLNRWINSGDRMSFVEFDSCLPQFDKYSAQRKQELQEMREEYVLVQKIDGAPLQVETMPKSEAFTTRYFIDVSSSLLVSGIKTAVVGAVTKDFDSLVDIEALYEDKFPTPEGVNRWRSDEEFGNQKLAGCNPAIIKKCHSVPMHMRELVTNPSLIEPHLEGMTVQQAIKAGKLYVIDLRYLADIECTNGRTLPGPTCLLFVRNSGDLVPVAIQLMPNAGADNPIFTPSDHEYTWLAAKMWFNLADCSLHQSVSHLGMTHLLMESVAVVTNRQLSRSHPLYRLLAPHFLFIMNINTLAMEALVSVGGWVDTAMNIGRTGMFNIIKANWKDWKLETNGNLPANLKIRGVEEIPNYFYKDDALLLWNAINKYVAEVVNQVYDTKEKFTGDFEVQNWLEELEGEAEIGMPKEVSREKLIEILTVFIFTSSVQHAAVNFGQYDEYAFPPNYPADLHGTRPTTRDELTEDSIVKMVPGKKQTLDILQITHVLSQRGTKELGNFEIRYGYDPIASKALDSFKEELKSIQSTIEEKNKTRKRKYDILQPKEIPNAISI